MNNDDINEVNEAITHLEQTLVNLKVFKKHLETGKQLTKDQLHLGKLALAQAGSPMQDCQD